MESVTSRPKYELEPSVTSSMVTSSMIVNNNEQKSNVHKSFIHYQSDNRAQDDGNKMGGF